MTTDISGTLTPGKAQSMTAAGSRIKGMGSLLRSLRALVRRTDKYGAHRASTAEDRRWANVLADNLDAAYRVALTPAAVVSLEQTDRRQGLASKSSAGGRRLRKSLFGRPGRPQARPSEVCR